MARVVLTGGAYQARSLIAGAQRCVNLYPESNPSDSQLPVPVTHYPTPGLLLLATSPNVSGWRGLYRASNGRLYGVCGGVVYYISDLYNLTVVGAIADGASKIGWSDNGEVIVIVDGSTSGYVIKMSDDSFSAIDPTNFYGADRVEYITTFFIFNRPGTTQFYISVSVATYAMFVGGTAFDPLDIASKSSSADNIATLIAVHQELWLVGLLKSAVWVGTGAADFFFGELPGSFIEHGCVAKYSVAQQDISVFWLSQDLQGNGIIVRSEGYGVKRISTHAIEADIQSYDFIADAFAYCYQQEGHAFYVITFPRADKSWAYEMQTGQWHELASIDNNGVLHRHRANCYAFAYGINIVGDFSNGKLYRLDPNTFTDNESPIPRIRSFPHLLDDGKRVLHLQFIADMEVGQEVGGSSDDPPQVSLRWSDTRGASFGNPVMQSMGATGQFYTQISWNRMGYARDRVYELSWSAPVRTALNGAFIQTKTAKS